MLAMEQTNTTLCRILSMYYHNPMSSVVAESGAIRSFSERPGNSERMISTYLFQKAAYSKNKTTIAEKCQILGSHATLHLFVLASGQLETEEHPC